MAKKKTTGVLGFNPLKLPQMVISPFRNRVQFVIERLLLSGTMARLAVGAGLIGLVALVMGVMGYVVAMGTAQSFSNPGEAVWWAFLRLSDPGYLGDDEGMGLRVVSTLVTVAGYVLFLGILVAILTQGLHEWIRRLEMGLTPISARNHVIILGWSGRTPGLVRNMMESEERVLMFLRRLGVRRLKLVLMAEEVTPQLTEELWSHVGADRKRSRVILRSGSPLRLDHLNRVDYLRASAIVLPSENLRSADGASHSDNTVLKTILSISNSLRYAEGTERPPLLVAELYDARKLPVALHSYRGPIEVVAGDEVISRMIAQMVRHPRIGHVYRELLTHGVGNEFFARTCPQAWVGRLFWAVAQEVEEAVLMGVTRTDGAGVALTLNPGPEHVLAADEKVLFMARRWEDGDAKVSGVEPSWPRPEVSLGLVERPGMRILVIGWSRRIPALLSELESYGNQRFEVTVASRNPLEVRERQLSAYGAGAQRMAVMHVVTDCTVPEQLTGLKPESFDTVLCLASDLTKTDAEADARTLVAHAILVDHLGEREDGAVPRLVLELLDELNVALIDSERCEHLLSPQVLSHMLAQVALRREMNAIFAELFNSGETEITFRNPVRYGVEAGVEMSFVDLEALARRHNEVALGHLKHVERAGTHGGVHLNPPRQERWRVESGDQFVVLRK